MAATPRSRPDDAEHRGFGHAAGSSTLLRTVGGAVAIGVLLMVFAAYLAPEMALTLAMQVWSCF